jgi:hypothetical protein
MIGPRCNCARKWAAKLLDGPLPQVGWFVSFPLFFLSTHDTPSVVRAAARRLVVDVWTTNAVVCSSGLLSVKSSFFSPTARRQSLRAGTRKQLHTPDRNNSPTDRSLDRPKSTHSAIQIAASAAAATIIGGASHRTGGYIHPPRRHVIEQLAKNHMFDSLQRRVSNSKQGSVSPVTKLLECKRNKNK